MRILHINTYYDRGGAAAVTRQIHNWLRHHGIDSHALFFHQWNRDESYHSSIRATPIIPRTRVKLGRRLDRLPLKRYPERNFKAFSLNWFPNGIAKQINDYAPDVVHLHWIGEGYVPVAALDKIHAPLVWTLHDSWTFTGGCHVPSGCERYQNHCGYCPQLKSGKKNDISAWHLKQKQQVYSQRDISLIVPSNWVAQCAADSALLRTKTTHIIPNPVDTTIWRPLDRIAIRQALHLPQDKEIIIFGAVGAVDDPNKGLENLLTAFQQLVQDGWQDRLHLVVFGTHESHHVPDPGVPMTITGYLDGDLLLPMYIAAADVLVMPSFQETFGKTAAEALACGTPVVAFGATGLLDVVDHQHNGYLAQPYDNTDFARGIAWILNHPDRPTLGYNAREKVLRSFAIDIVGKQYLQHYESVLGKV